MGEYMNNYLPGLLFNRNAPYRIGNSRFGGVFEELERYLGDVLKFEDESGTFALDVEDTEEGYHIKANVPGATIENIEVSLDKNVLTVAINKNEQKEKEEKRGPRKFLVKERRSIASSRSVLLPTPVDTQNMKAALKDGILIIDIKKDIANKAKKIDVQVSA
jgi:HSP20 family protein